jgi:hypothetical protein
MGAIDFKANIAGIAGWFAPMGRSCGKPMDAKLWCWRGLEC